MIKTLSSGITINLVGLAATLVGLEATCGMLFAKELSFAGTSPWATQVLSQAKPVQALDIFVVQVRACRLSPSPLFVRPCLGTPTVAAPANQQGTAGSCDAAVWLRRLFALAPHATVVSCLQKGNRRRREW